MIAEQIMARGPLENIAWQGDMVKTIPPSLIPTEGRNTVHENPVAPYIPLLSKVLLAHFSFFFAKGLQRTQSK